MENVYKDADFIDDEEKMYDFVRLTKEEFLSSYSYLTEDEYNNTKRLYEERNRWNNGSMEGELILWTSRIL